MSWDHWDHPAKCRNCDNTGTLTISMSDWIQFRVRWEGFNGIAVYYFQPERSRARCLICGSTSVSVGEG